MGEDGAWLELAWESPQKISRIQLTFDTGFHRELTLSAMNRVNHGIVRAPQPETVRDYTVSYRPPGSEEWKQLAAVRDNHQRLVRHHFPTVEAEAVRIHVRKTNGDPKARIFEVRCYA